MDIRQSVSTALSPLFIYFLYWPQTLAVLYQGIPTSGYILIMSSFFVLLKSTWKAVFTF